MQTVLRPNCRVAEQEWVIGPQTGHYGATIASAFTYREPITHAVGYASGPQRHGFARAADHATLSPSRGHASGGRTRVAPIPGREVGRHRPRLNAAVHHLADHVPHRPVRSASAARPARIEPGHGSSGAPRPTPLPSCPTNTEVAGPVVSGVCKP